MSSPGSGGGGGGGDGVPQGGAHINGQVFLVHRDKIGLYQPLTIVDEFSRDADADAADMLKGLAQFDFPDLADAYK